MCRRVSRSDGARPSSEAAWRRPSVPSSDTVGAQAGSRETTAAGDRGDDVGVTREDGIGGDGIQRVPLAGGDVGQEGVDGCGGAPGGLRTEFGGELAEGAELLQELSPESEQVAELPEVLRPGRGRCNVIEQAEAAQHGGIHAVVLRQLPEGFGEARRVRRFDQDGLDAGIGEALAEIAVAAPGALEDGAGRAVPEQPIAHGTAAAPVVSEHAIDAALEEVDVELRLADIDAGGRHGSGFVHSCVLVLLRFGFVPTLPLR